MSWRRSSYEQQQASAYDTIALNLDKKLKLHLKQVAIIKAAVTIP